MKKVISVFIAIIFITLLLPLAIVYLFGIDGKEEKESMDSVKVFVSDENRTEEMDVNEYLKRVVSAEMPVDFEEEALKAQAVAARTYLYSHIEAFQNGNFSDGHPDAPICTDSTHCQAYITEEKRRESWGEIADANWRKISGAVMDTDGEIMTYNGEIISALFHSSSAGATEAAADVWGSDVPYLQSVASVGDDRAPSFLSSVTISEDEFKHMIDKNVSGTNWTGELFSNINRSEAGGIITLDVGGVNIKGTELRSIFSLRSTTIDLKQENGDVIMNVKGYGHGVGMSQYGANYLASQGEKYDAILKTYYTGVEIEHR